MRGGGVQTSRPHHVGINRREQSQETGRFGSWQSQASSRRQVFGVTGCAVLPAAPPHWTGVSGKDVKPIA